MLCISVLTRTDLLFIKVHLLHHYVEFYFMILIKHGTGIIFVNTKVTSVSLPLD